MKNMLRWFGVFFFVCTPAWAEDAQTGAAHLRLINASNKPINGIVGDLTFKNVGGISAYRPLEAGDYEASVGKVKHTLELASGKSYSLAYLTGGGRKRLLLLEDAGAADGALTRMQFYNFSDAPARLRAPNFNSDLLPAAAPGQSLAQDIEPLGYDVAVTVEEVDVATYPDMALERGASYSFYVAGTEPKYHSGWTQDERRKK